MNSSAMKRTISSSRYEISRGPHHRRKHRGQENRTEQSGCDRFYAVEEITKFDKQASLRSYFFDLQYVQKCDMRYDNSVFPLCLGTSVKLLCGKQEGTKHSVYTAKLFPLCMKHCLMEYFEPSDFLTRVSLQLWLWSLFYLWYKSSLNKAFSGQLKCLIFFNEVESGVLKEEIHFTVISTTFQSLS